MIAKIHKFNKVLLSLRPGDQEELSILRAILSCAQSMNKKVLSDQNALEENSGNDYPANPKEFLTLIPDDSKRYLYGLSEALDIYEQINGHALRPQHLTLADDSVKKLRLIRDMCLDSGIRLAY